MNNVIWRLGPIVFLSMFAAQVIFGGKGEQEVQKEIQRDKKIGSDVPEAEPRTHEPKEPGSSLNADAPKRDSPELDYALQVIKNFNRHIHH